MFFLFSIVSVTDGIKCVMGVGRGAFTRHTSQIYCTHEIQFVGTVFQWFVLSSKYLYPQPSLLNFVVLLPPNRNAKP